MTQKNVAKLLSGALIQTKGTDFSHIMTAISGTTLTLHQLNQLSDSEIHDLVQAIQTIQHFADKFKAPTNTP